MPVGNVFDGWSVFFAGEPEGVEKIHGKNMDDGAKMHKKGPGLKRF
jgi:hypothetical protein